MTLQETNISVSKNLINALKLKDNEAINKTIPKTLFSKSDVNDIFSKYNFKEPVEMNPPKMSRIESLKAKYWRTSEDDSILNLRRVDNTVIRSAAPLYEGDFKKLKDTYNVNTIIDLRGLGTTTQGNVDWAETQARKAGISNYVHIPIYDSKHAPKPEELKQALREIRKAKDENTAVLIQCRHGIDRTGTFVANYQAKELKMPKEKVLQHMKECGYDWYHEWTRPIQKTTVESFFPPKKVSS